MSTPPFAVLEYGMTHPYNPNLIWTEKFGCGVWKEKVKGLPAPVYKATPRTKRKTTTLMLPRPAVRTPELKKVIHELKRARDRGHQLNHLTRVNKAVISKAANAVKREIKKFWDNKR